MQFTTRAVIAFFLVAMVGATPLAIGEESEETADGQAPMQCVNVAVRHFGEGIGVFVGPLEVISLTLTSNTPGEGVTLGLLIVPSLCGPSATIGSDLTHVVYAMSGESAPKIPSLP